MTGKLSPLREFVKDGVVLVVEPSPGFSSIYQTVLQTMGLPIEQVVVLRKFSEALKFVIEKKPRLIVTEYEIETSFGLDLLEEQEKQYEALDRISLITTKNSSDAAVAEAAEGQVDGYLLKPFPGNSFQKKLVEILEQKIKPSAYHQKLAVGRKLFSSRDFDHAVAEFRDSKPMHSKPSLACYHAGVSYQAKGELSKAVAEFKEGQNYQPLHYKCLLAEFETLLAQSNYPEAYKLTATIRENYPVTSKRLGQIFVAAVFTSHFEELPTLYEMFARLDQRSPELIHISSTALLTAGKFLIKQNSLEKSQDYFNLGLLISNRQFDYIEKIVNEYIRIAAPDMALNFLANVKNSDMGTPAHQRLSLRVEQLRLPPTEWAEKARKLILAGNADSEISQKVVQVLARQGQQAHIQLILDKVSKEDPALHSILEKMSKDYSPREAKSGV